MTTPIIPGFIGDLFKREIYKIQLDTVERICQVYNLDKNEVLKKTKISDVLVEHPKLRIYWKHDRPFYGARTHTPKCIALKLDSDRVKHEQSVEVLIDGKKKKLARCPKSQSANCEFCKTHLKCFQNDTLQYGTIYDHDECEFMRHEKKEEILHPCIARVYDKNERTLEQCTRCQKDASTPFCTIHSKQEVLTYGTIHDEIPKSLMKKMATKIY